MQVLIVNLLNFIFFLSYVKIINILNYHVCIQYSKLFKFHDGFS